MVGQGRRNVFVGTPDTLKVNKTVREDHYRATFALSGEVGTGVNVFNRMLAYYTELHLEDRWVLDEDEFARQTPELVTEKLGLWFGKDGYVNLNKDGIVHFDGFEYIVKGKPELWSSFTQRMWDLIDGQTLRLYPS